MPRIPALLERFYQPLYDSAEATPQSTYVEFFTSGIAQGKTIAQTNMDEAGHLTYPNNFDICGVSVKPDFSADPAQVRKFADGAWFRLFIGTKDYLVVPLSLVLDLSGEAQMPATTDLNQDLLGLLLKRRDTQPAFSLPEDATITLIPQLHFKATITLDANGSSENLKFKTILFGYYKRAVH